MNRKLITLSTSLSTRRIKGRVQIDDKIAVEAEIFDIESNTPPLQRRELKGKTEIDGRIFNVRATDFGAIWRAIGT